MTVTKTKSEKPAAKAPDEDQQEVNEQKPTGDQPEWDRLMFNNQIEAYQFLQWSCPSEYHFKAGINQNGQRLVTLLIRK